MSWLDSLYLNKKILERLAEIDKVKKFIYELNSQELSLRGYIFLIEISINSFIHSTEFLFNSDEFYNLIHWGDIEEKREEMRKLLEEKSKEISFISKLEKIRKKFTSLRFASIIDESFLKNLLKELLLQTEEINSFYFSNLEFKENLKGKENARNKMASLVFSVLNYVESDFGLGKIPEEAKITPLFIAGSYYTIMPFNLRKNYHLQNKKISELEYVKGYSQGLTWIYGSLGVDKTLLKKLIDSKGWEDIHHSGARIIESYNKGYNSLNEDMYEIINGKTEIRIENKEIKTIGELRYALRDRNIKTLEELHNGDYPVRRSLLRIFTEGLLLNSDEESKAEIIEFQTKRNDGEETRYSYALFLPVGTGIWNASQWILFDDISVENSWEPKCYFRDFYLKRINSYHKIVNFKEYVVDEKCLIEYRKRKDTNYYRMLEDYKQLENSHSLLVELIGFFYFMKKEKNIIDFGWHIDPTNKYETDLDAFFVTDTKKVIIQSKKSLKITNPLFELDSEIIEKEDFNLEEHLNLEEDCKEILFHFKKAIELLPRKYSSQKIEKKLFVFENYQEDWIKEKLKIYLKDKGIDLIYFDEIESEKEIFPKDLINKLNSAFDRIIPEELKEE